MDGNEKNKGEEQETLFQKLNAHDESGSYPFHMPGHKRALPSPGNPYALDITEIGGFDSLHHAAGVLKELSLRAAALYHADETFLLVNGSTAGLLCAVSAAVHAGGKLLMARNCHRAVYNAAYLNHLQTVYLYPKWIGEWGVCGGIAPEDVEQALGADPKIEAVLITSPTYEGIVSDVAAIAACCHRYGVPLIVDEAHGAHFGFSKEMPRSAATCGADIVVQSLHKTMPAMTQTALLHVNGTLVDRTRVIRFFSVYQTSSPSYVLMGSIDACISMMETQGEQLFAAYEERLTRLRTALGKNKRLRLMTPDESWRSTYAVYAADPGRLVLSLRGRRTANERKLTGNEQEAEGIRLRAGSGNAPQNGQQLLCELRDTYRLEMEMAGLDYVVAIVTPLDTDEGLARLCDAAAQIDRKLDVEETESIRLPKSIRQSEEQAANGQLTARVFAQTAELQLKAQTSAQTADGQAVTTLLPQTVLPIAEAYDGGTKCVALAESVGCVSAEFLYFYPPGIPIVAPGERIRKEHTALVRQAAAQGISVEGCADMSLETIRTVVL